MSAPSLLPAPATALLGQSMEWRVLGLLFEYPDDAWRRNLQALLNPLTDPGLRAIAEAALEHSSPGLHFALFGPAGSVPVREVKYQGGVQLGYLMSELAAYYEAFGFEPHVEEAPDHLAVQLGFISFLKLKQAYASANSDTEEEEVTAGAVDSFLRDHIAMQAEPVLRGLEVFGPDFLIEAARRIVSLAGPAPRSDFPIASPEMDDDGEHCGSALDAESLIQLKP